MQSSTLIRRSGTQEIHQAASAALTLFRACPTPCLGYHASERLLFSKCRGESGRRGAKVAGFPVERRPRWLVTSVAGAQGSPATWCSTWATSPPVIISRRSTVRILTRPTHFGCGCAPPAAWHSSSANRLLPKSRSALNRKLSSHRPPLRSSASQQPDGSPVGAGWSSSPALMEARGWTCWLIGAWRRSPRVERGDVVIDSFGMMHDPDQAAALAERMARVAPGGVLLLQYHSLETIVRLGQWNALRHGHFAYYSTSTLVGMLEANGFSPQTAWRFDLYGGTILLAACRESDAGPAVDGSVAALLTDDSCRGVRDPVAVGRLHDEAEVHTRGLRDWLVAQQINGRSVIGYGAASRAVALLCRAQVDRRLLPAVVDSSTAKHGLRMPGTDVPIVEPGLLLRDGPHDVLLFVPDLLAEVQRAYPEVENAGGSWVDAEVLRG